MAAVKSGFKGARYAVAVMTDDITHRPMLPGTVIGVNDRTRGVLVIEYYAKTLKQIAAWEAAAELAKNEGRIAAWRRISWGTAY